MSDRRRRILFVILGMLLVGLVLQYTVGGGWTELMREIKRKQLAREGSEPWELPADFGPEDAKVRILVVLNHGNPCHKDYGEALQTLFSPFQDRVRVDFQDSQAPETRKSLEGHPVSCEMALLINGLNQIKVPWRKKPILLQGPSGGENVTGEDLRKVVTWALTAEGQKSLKEQQAAFEAERQRRIAKEKALAAEEARKQAAPAK